MRLTGLDCYRKPVKKISKSQERTPERASQNLDGQAGWLALRYRKKIPTSGLFCSDLLEIYYVLSNITLFLSFVNIMLFMKFIKHSPAFMGKLCSEQSVYALNSCSRTQRRL